MLTALSILGGHPPKNAPHNPRPPPYPPFGVVDGDPTHDNFWCYQPSTSSKHERSARTGTIMLRTHRATTRIETRIPTTIASSSNPAAAVAVVVIPYGRCSPLKSQEPLKYTCRGPSADICCAASHTQLSAHRSPSVSRGGEMRCMHPLGVSPEARHVSGMKATLFRKYVSGQSGINVLLTLSHEKKKKTGQETKYHVWYFSKHHLRVRRANTSRCRSSSAQQHEQDL